LIERTLTIEMDRDTIYFVFLREMNPATISGLSRSRLSNVCHEMEAVRWEVLVKDPLACWVSSSGLAREAEPDCLRATFESFSV
jgi:hypothetical protein